MGMSKKNDRKIDGYLHDFGKLLVDIAKLAFGSLVLGTIIRWDIPHATVFILGDDFFNCGSNFGHYHSKKI
jgi:hypothetical protein